MKFNSRLFFLLSATALMSGAAAWADLSTDMNSLGGNKDLIRRARALDPDSRVAVVQNRTVDRNLRLEIGVNYGTVTGGDPYVRTDNLGAHLDFHFTPRWSVGARYYNSNNGLTPEGKRVFDNANSVGPTGGNYLRPDVDYATDTYMGVINWYPMYGKLNMLDMGVAQFDIYFLGGGGQIMLSSGSAPVWTAGGGLGFWLAQHLSMRTEVRYQTYEDQIYSGSRQLNQVILSATLGFLL
jgi:outer membrane immunogenic protein